jgi:YfiR/HmsC-like
VPAPRMRAAGRYLSCKFARLAGVAAPRARRDPPPGSAIATARGFFTLTSWCLVAMAYTATAAAPEFNSNAALIFKIGKFVRWPQGAFSGAGGTLRLCIVGNDDFGESIDSLAGQALQGRVIVVAHLPDPDQSAADCRIAFIGGSERERLPALLSSVARSPVLTISDINGFASQGGMVGLATSARKIHFEINAAASKRARIEIGAQLLQLATLIEDQPTDAKP